jgi:hypothetical protein
MNQCQVLNEIEKVVDTPPKYDKLLSRTEANQFERERVEKVLGEGCEKSLHYTAPQWDNERPSAENKEA